MSYAVSITQDGTVLNTAEKYVDQDIVVGMSDSIKKAAQTYTPTTADQTIPAGKYLSGAQTIKGDANLVAGNIRSGKSIFGVAGSLTPGITPSGTINITANGTYDVTDKASAAVSVPVGAGKAGTVTVPTATHSITIDTGKTDAEHIVVYTDEMFTSSYLWLFFASKYHSILGRYSGSAHMDELVSDKSAASVATSATISNGSFTLVTPNYMFDAKTYNWIAW